MTDSNLPDEEVPYEPGTQPKTPGLDVDAEIELQTGDELAPNEAFQRLASDVRLAMLVHLLRAEQSDEGPLSFTELQTTVGSDSSAGFAYHLRQLSGHFVRKEWEGYVLTPAGRRAAMAVLSGAFTDNEERRAS